jgi:hypothetical protein
MRPCGLVLAMFERTTAAFVSGDPGEKRSSTHQLSAPQGHGGNGRASRHPAGDRLADMRLRALKEPRHLREGEQIEFL